MMTPIIEITHLSFTFPDGTPALKDVNLQIFPGESLALIGPNGAGKSTLLLCLAGLLRGEGTIVLQGRELNPSNARELRRGIGVVFQDPDDQLFMPALEEDVAFGPTHLGWDPAEIEARVEAALSQVHLLHLRGKPPHHLSFGEKRRAALATALVMSPDLLLLDEPTSNLDPATRYELIRYLASLSATRIISTHDLDAAAALCHRCALLSGGRLIAADATEKILADASLLRAHRLLP
jgi:cobalt/nickel transport system ATP-binding protein